ncbi:MAG: S53 family peptidase [Thermoplasmata archaeon]
MSRYARAALLVLVGVLVTSSLALPGGASDRATKVTSSIGGLSNDAGPFYASAGEPLAGSFPIRLDLALAPAHASALAALDRALGNPRSPEYRDYLTESEFESRFAPSGSSITVLESYFRAHGGSHFNRSADGLALGLTLPADAIPATLSTRLLQTGNFAGEPLYRATSAPSLPAPLAALVSGIDGLTDTSATGAPLAAALLTPGPGQFVVQYGSHRQLLAGSDIAQAYGDSSLFPGVSNPNGTFATGTAVATLLMSGYNYTAREDVPPFDPAAVMNYFTSTFAPWWPLPTVQAVPVSVGGITPPPAGPFDPFTDDTAAVAENSLDLEMAGSMAPGARLVNFYFPESVLIATPGSGYSDIADDFALDLATALSANYSSARLTAVSNSYALPDLNDTLWNSELAHAEAIGVSVIAATGDEGNAPSALTGRIPGLVPDWPATAAFNSTGVLAVGGTELNLSGLPTSVAYSLSPPHLAYDTSIGGIASEAGWSSGASSGLYAGSEGGISTVYSEPSWQLHSAAQPQVVNTTEISGGTRLGRAVPDIALAASDVLVETAMGPTGPEIGIYDGTSIAAPLAAGAVAECAAVVGTPFGYLDPLLYRIGSFEEDHATPTNPFRDITVGSNYLFAAGPGWDALTGWGSLDVASLPAALTNASLTNYSYSGPAPSLPAPLPPYAAETTTAGPATPWALWATALLAATGLSVGLYWAGLREEASLAKPKQPGNPTAALRPEGPPSSLERPLPNEIPASPGEPPRERT